MILELGVLIIILSISICVGLFFIFQEKQSLSSVNTTTKKGATTSERLLVRGRLRELDIQQPQARLIQQKLESIIIGQPELIHGLILGLFSGKHVLIQSLPGMAKTMAVKSLASIVGLSFGRVQGTPDLLPTDLLGREFLRKQDTERDSGSPDAFGELDVKKGPIFHQIVLFDEINRTTPKVQSAFIQAMEEKQVTIGREILDLPKPFVVFATSNLSGSRGVYELPEAQLDRFGMCISLDYPDLEHTIIGGTADTPRAHEQQNSGAVVIDFDLVQQEIETVLVDDKIINYITALIKKTRELPNVIKVGCSPRSGKDLVQLSKTYAWLGKKSNVSRDMVDSLLEYVLDHRIVWVLGVNKQQIRTQIRDDVATGKV